VLITPTSLGSFPIFSITISSQAKREEGTFFFSSVPGQKLFSRSVYLSSRCREAAVAGGAFLNWEITDPLPDDHGQP